MNPFKKIKSILGLDFWSKNIFNGGSNLASTAKGTAYDSVWTLSGVEVIANCLASLKHDFKDAKGFEIERPTPEQQIWINLFAKPNNIFAGRQLWELTSMLYDIDGIAYWVLYGANNSFLSNVLEIPTRIVSFSKEQIRPRINKQTGSIVGWTLRNEGVSVELQMFQVIRFWKTNPKSYIEGLSIADKVGRALALDSKAKDTNSAFFSNGGRPSGVLQSTKPNVAEGELRSFGSHFAESYCSPANAGKVPVLPDWLKFTSDQNARDMDFQHLYNVNRDEFFGAHRVPKFYLSVTEDINYATAEVLDRVFWQTTMMPRAEVFASNINSSILAGTGLVFSFDFSDVPCLKTRQIEVKQKTLDLEKTKWVIANRMMSAGYPINWVNEKLGLGMTTVKEQWANQPRDAIELKLLPSNNADEKKTIDFDFGQSLKKNLTNKKKTIQDSIKELDFEAMDEFCVNVETKSISTLQAPLTKVIESYFERLQSSQIKRLESFLDGESYINKSNGSRELKEDNVDDVLFSEQKWNSILRMDVSPYYIKAYLSSSEVMRDELGGFLRFNPTDQLASDAAVRLGNKIVDINKRIRDNLKDAVSESLKAGATRGEMIDSINGIFKTSFNRASTIARNETQNAMSVARAEALEAEVSTKLWTSSNHSNVRATHRHYSGLGAKPMDYEYSEGLKYPHDPNCDEAAEIVNCSCVLVSGD